MKKYYLKRFHILLHLLRIAHSISSKCIIQNHFSILFLAAKNVLDRKLYALCQRYLSQIRTCSSRILALQIFICSFWLMTENNHVYRFHIFKTLVCTSGTATFTRNNFKDGFSFLNLRSWVAIPFNLYSESIWEDISKMSKGRIKDDLLHLNTSLFTIYIYLLLNSHIQISIFQVKYEKTCQLHYY
jgi:hypothetical protein